MGDAANAAIGADPTQHFRQILLPDGPRRSRLGLAFFSKFLAEAVLAVVDFDAGLGAPGIWSTSIAFSEARTRTPLNRWASSRVKTAPIGTNPVAGSVWSGIVAMN